MDLSIFKDNLGETLFGTLEDIAAFIDCNYNMNLMYNGKDELKFQRNKKTLITFYIEPKKIKALMIFGKNEREKYKENKLEFSDYINAYYDKSKTYHDGKWMFIDLINDSYTKDIINMICIKKKPNNKAITMCVCKCELCAAYTKNIKKEDRRKELSMMWGKYYDLNVNPKDIYCDGCRSRKKDAKLIDNNCPVRKCVLEKDLNSCADCVLYPCEIFIKRKGFSACEAKVALRDSFDSAEYETYLKAYDNKTRIDNYKKTKPNMP